MPNIFCTQTASHLLNECLESNGLKYLTKLYLKRDVMEYDEAIKHGTDSEEFANYAIADAVNTYDLYKLFAPEIEKQGLHHLAYDIEFPFSRVLCELAINGIKADRDKAKEMKENTQHLYYKLEDEMLQLFDKGYDVGITKRSRKVFVTPQINFNSGQQVAECLQQLGVKLTDKTTKGRWATKTNILKKLRDEIKRKLLSA